MQKSLQQFQPLGQFLDFRFGTGIGYLLTDICNFLLQIEIFHQLLNALGTHRGLEVITEIFHGLKVFFIGQQVAALKRRHTWVRNHK